MSSEAQSKIPGEGALCWIEIPARDVQKLKTFYGSLFPELEWKAGNADHPETSVAMFEFKHPKGMSGGIVKMPDDCGPNTQALGSGFTLYYFVENLEKSEARIHELGGKTVMGKTPESTNGWFMNMTDPEGNRFGIFQVA